MSRAASHIPELDKRACRSRLEEECYNERMYLS
jgi:hypothetical protein